MPFPLLAIGFAGLLGARELDRRSNRRREEAADRAEAEGFSEALDRLSGKGQLAFDGYGPPTPVGAGVSQLDQQQISSLQALGVNSPEVAFNQAVAWTEQNRLQANVDSSRALTQAGLDIQRDNADLNVAKLDEDKRQFGIGQLASQAEVARAAAGMSDPNLAMRHAVEDNRATYGYLDAQGNAGIAPVKGTAPFQANQNATRAQTDLLNNMNIVRGTLNQVGIQQDPGLLTNAATKARLSNIWVGLNKVAELGALTGSDLELLVSQFPDSTSFTNWATANPEALDAAMAAGSEGVVSNLQQLVQQSAPWAGTDDRLTAQALANLQANQQLDAITASRLFEEQQAIASPRNLALIGEGRGDELTLEERRAALLDFGARSAGGSISLFGRQHERGQSTLERNRQRSDQADEFGRTSGRLLLSAPDFLRSVF